MAWRQILTLIHCLMNYNVWIQTSFFMAWLGGVSFIDAKEGCTLMGLVRWVGGMTQPPTYPHHSPLTPPYLRDKWKRHAFGIMHKKTKGSTVRRTQESFLQTNVCRFSSPRPSPLRNSPKLSRRCTAGYAHSDQAQGHRRSSSLSNRGREEEGRESACVCERERLR